MSSRNRAVYILGNVSVRGQPRHLRSHSKYVYVARLFTSLSEQNKGVVYYPPESTRKEAGDGTRRSDRGVDPSDMAMDAAGSMAEMAKAGVVGAMETGLKVGEMAKKTMDNMWDTTRKTTETVRDSVADDDISRNYNDRDGNKY